MLGQLQYTCFVFVQWVDLEMQIDQCTSKSENATELIQLMIIPPVDIPLQEASKAAIVVTAEIVQ